MGDELKNFYNGDVTCISNEFLNKYLADVNPVYLKVFIYLQWKKNSSISQMADDLNLTENDVEGAMKYWKKQMKKMGMSYNVPVVEKVKPDTKDDTLKSQKETKESIDKESKPKNTQKDDENKKELLFHAENVIPQTLTSQQVKIINYIYDELGLDVKLIKFLIEYCVDIGKTTHSYMKTVAEDWSKNEITTVGLARKYVKEREEQKASKVAKYKQKFEKKYIGINAPSSSDGGDFDKIAMEKMRQKRKKKASR